MSDKPKYTSIGGQALIEGIMMRGKDKIAIAIRKSDGEIITKVDPIKKGKFSFMSKIPLLRGVYAFFSSMIVGIKALNYSASFYDDGIEYKKTKLEMWVENTFKDKADAIFVGFSMIFALIITALFFLVLPAYFSKFLTHRIESKLALSLLEGGFRFLLFLGYIVIISRMKDIQRVFEYHGAEHKTIRCFEARAELTPENAMKFTRLHPRCGTSFLLIVVMLSIVIFAFLGHFETPLYRVLLKFIFMPLVAGISYEIIKYAGSHDNFLVNIISWPGLMFQKLTTNEPDEGELECAIIALKAVLTEEDINEFS